MVTIDVRHKVQDFLVWKAAFDAAQEVRRAAGEVSCRIYSVHGSSNDVLVSMDWISLESAQAFLASPKLQDGMSKAGVRGMPHITILDRRDNYHLDAPAQD